MPAVRSHEPVAEIVPSFHFSGLLFRRLRSAGVRNPDRRTRSGQFPGAERSRLRGGAARNVVRPDLDHDGQGSKAWYEVYERYIFEIEQEEAEGLKIPERYRLGALCRPWEMNGNLFSKKAGRYSPSRLNITIGSVTLTAWLTVGLIHYAASVILYAEGPALCWQPLILALIPASFLAVLVTAARNMWGRSRSLVKP